jgi:transposase-like protein
VVTEAVISYVEGLGSYRTLARLYTQRLGSEVSRTTLNRWVETAGAAAKTPWQISKELAPPGWGGWLGVDGKYLRIGRRSTAVLMVAVDQTTADIVHAKVVQTESGDQFAELITETVRAGYPLRGVVADLGPGAPHQSFPQASRNYFGNLPFQACRVHFDRRLDQILSTPRQSPGCPLNTELKTRIRSILYADTYHQAIHRYHQLAVDEPRYLTSGSARRAIRSLRRTFGLYMTHHRHPGLPPDANITENVIRQLNRKLKPMEHLATTETAQHFTRLLIAAYRWKPFTDSTPNRNGHSPLQLAGAKLPTTHWLTYHQQQHSM